MRKKSTYPESVAQPFLKFWVEVKRKSIFKAQEYLQIWTTS